MKKATAFLCIFILGINSFLYKYTAEAEENQAGSEGSEAAEEAAAEEPSGTSGSDAGTAPDGPQLKGSMKVLGDSGAEDITASGGTPYKGIPSEADSGLVSLLIPEKLDVVLNPWEMDGQGQVYSEDYIVRNCGETAGTITLSGISCRAAGGGADVRADSAGIHDGAGKSIYIEMDFSGEEKLAITQEGADYRKYLEPGGEISFRFSGAMNENAWEEWESGDIEITILYEWEEDTGTVSGDDAGNAGESGGAEDEAAGGQEAGSGESEAGDGSADVVTEAGNAAMPDGAGTGNTLETDSTETDGTETDGTETDGTEDGGTDAGTDSGDGTEDAPGEPAQDGMTGQGG